MDRLSTGSKESNMSTQSDWIGGEKKKKSGLIGECVFFTELMQNYFILGRVGSSDYCLFHRKENLDLGRM